MAKKGNLASALNDVIPPPAPLVREGPRAAARGAGRPDREGMALVGGHLPARYSKAIKILSAETDKSQRVLFQEALDMLLVRYASKG